MLADETNAVVAKNRTTFRSKFEDDNKEFLISFIITNLEEAEQVYKSSRPKMINYKLISNRTRQLMEFIYLFNDPRIREIASANNIQILFLDLISPFLFDKHQDDSERAIIWLNTFLYIFSCTDLTDNILNVISTNFPEFLDNELYRQFSPKFKECVKRFTTFDTSPSSSPSSSSSSSPASPASWATARSSRQSSPSSFTRPSSPPSFTRPSSPPSFTRPPSPPEAPATYSSPSVRDRVAALSRRQSGGGKKIKTKLNKQKNKPWNNKFLKKIRIKLNRQEPNKPWDNKFLNKIRAKLNRHQSNNS